MFSGTFAVRFSPLRNPCSAPQVVLNLNILIYYIYQFEYTTKRLYSARSAFLSNSFLV